MYGPALKLLRIKHVAPLSVRAGKTGLRTIDVSGAQSLIPDPWEGRCRSVEHLSAQSVTITMSDSADETAFLLDERAFYVGNAWAGVLVGKYQTLGSLTVQPT